MSFINCDIAIIGAGGAGLRAAIAVAQAEPLLKIALISKVYPMRSHSVAAEGGRGGPPPSPRITTVLPIIFTIRSPAATGCVNRTWSIRSCATARGR